MPINIHKSICSQIDQVDGYSVILWRVAKLCQRSGVQIRASFKNETVRERKTVDNGGNWSRPSRS